MGWPVGWTSIVDSPDISEHTWDVEPCPRVATGVPNRVGRLKAIGNGQVPQCMVRAWSELSDETHPV